ncbi:phosphotransferase [Legionella sp. CNM-1927-20]|uniref:phosphotransferase n=1 Tax=Legionella sp. CNM-1927-20 TaxID=3422221 RepID=UPI00403B0231
MNHNEQALQWAIQYLSSWVGCEQISSHRVVNTPYSVVTKLETNQGVFYLKQTPELLFKESKTLTFLNVKKFRNIPEIIAENVELYCFLTTSCGDESLRQLFKERMDVKQLELGIINYTKIQRLLENQLGELLSLFSDWRLSRLPSLFYKLLENEKLLVSDGLTIKKIDKLHQLYPTFTNLCDELSQFKIPETINHCDFHENNMIWNSKTGEVSIIDWAEVVVSHPFFSLNGCLWNINYFHKNKIIKKDFNRLKHICVAPWIDFLAKGALLRALKLCDQINGVFAALAYERMYCATKNLTKTVQREHRGAIAGCLTSFLSANKNIKK